MAIATTYGTATISATLGAGGVIPSVSITATVTHSTSNAFVVQPSIVPRDVEGSIGLLSTRLNATTMRVSADRQLPAGTEIVFDWATFDGTA